MIKGVHTMFYSSDAEGLRKFLKEKLGFKATDVGEGWLIFDLPEADMGAHPSDESGKNGQPAGTHDISFYCDDIQQTVNELKAKGVEFIGDITDVGYARAIYFKMPGDIEVQLYQPYYEK